MELIINIISSFIATVFETIIKRTIVTFNNNKKKSIKFKKYSNAKKIILYIWDFPVDKKDQESWAIKESQVLLGNLENAKKKPGLGIAVLSIEFALDYFGKIAESRINNCINWGIERTQKSEPYFILYKKTDENITDIKLVPDFRHTIALGIILSKTKKHESHLKNYLEYLIDNQQEDGGWKAGQGYTTSELFSCIYAIELLMLNKDNHIFKESITNSITKGTKWLIEKQDKSNLWKSGVFNNYDWDSSFASTWVLNRLIPFKLEEYNPDWNNIVINTSMNILKSIQDINWHNYSKLQRFRIEARIAAALYKGKKFKYYQGIISEQVNSFLDKWKKRTNDIMKNIELNEFDLATALFIAEPLLGSETIRKTIRKTIIKKNIF